MQGTWFYDGEDACGDWDTSSELIVAVSAQIYNGGQYCGQVSIFSCLMPAYIVSFSMSLSHQMVTKNMLWYMIDARVAALVILVCIVFLFFCEDSVSN